MWKNVENLGGRSQYLSTAVWWSSNTGGPRLDAGDELMIWGWVKTLVPSEPQVIAGIYGCSSH